MTLSNSPNMNFKYLVYNSSNIHEKYLLRCDSKEDIRERIRVKLNLNTLNFIVECYDTEFEDFYIVEDEDEFPDIGKIRITVRSEPDIEIRVKLEDEAESEEVVPNDADLQHSNQMKHDLATFIEAMEEEIPVQASGLNFAPPAAHSDEECTQQRPNSMSLYNFKLNVSNMPRSLRDSLVCGTYPNTQMKRMLLEFLYEEMTQYSYYFKRDQYTEVVRVLLETFPHLVTGSDHPNPLSFWRQSLVTKVQNMRKRRDRDVPEVTTKRIRFLSKKECKLSNSQEVKPLPYLTTDSND